MAYFILEEHNERYIWFLFLFDLYVLVFTYYDENKDITAVDVQYDQLSFFLHCMGTVQVHAWLAERVINPIVLVWAKMFHASGLVNPFMFLLQLMIVPMALAYWCFLAQ